MEASSSLVSDCLEVVGLLCCAWRELMLRAGIDLGTNSFLLTIAELEEGDLQCVVEEKLFSVRLGEELEPDMKIKTPAWIRAMDALAYFQERLQHHNIPPTHVRAVGTSALRRASNGTAFVAEAKEKFAFEIEILAGLEEAKTSWRGALSGLALPSENAPCLIDIGGGSTEFTWSGGQEVASLQMGALKFREAYIHHDPPLPEELEQIKQHTQRLLHTLPPIPTPKPMLAVAGTATTLVAIARQIEPYDGDLVHGQLLVCEEIDRILDQLMALPLEERQTLPGLSIARADVIIPGIVILKTTLAHLGVKQILVSDRGIRYGILTPKVEPS
ncbi:MAG: hypothetical protein CL932_04710 [Deltaproteobacteria bacterium]|nr:hypothetical protein [Deltaproteobacteria bacterium]